MILEKFTCHNWPEGVPEYYLVWFPESEPEGIFWGPIPDESFRDDIERRILARDTFLRAVEETGADTLPDARYTHEKGLTNYR